MLVIPAAVLAEARRVADAFCQRTGVAVDAAELLCGRAGLLGLSPQGRISAGGATRLMRSDDGWCALTLSRQDDLDAIPALLESDAVGDDPWPVGWWAPFGAADAGLCLALCAAGAASGWAWAQGQVRTGRDGPRVRRRVGGMLAAVVLLAGVGAIVSSAWIRHPHDPTADQPQRPYVLLEPGDIHVDLEQQRLGDDDERQ